MNPQSVLITGANRGIGLYLVKNLNALLTPPRHIFATTRNLDAAIGLRQLAEKHSNIHILQLDVKDHTKYEHIVKEMESILAGDGLNLLINNAGIIVRDSLQDATKEAMMEVYEVNTVAPTLIAQAFLPLLKKAARTSSIPGLSCSKAAIINMSSKVGSCEDNSSGGIYPYRASKGALNVVTVSMAVDLKGDGILAAVLHPGWVQTDMGGQNALITTEQSVQGLLQVMAGLDESKTGKFFDYKGIEIPW